MNKIVFVSTLLLFSLTFFGQSKLILQHKTKTNKKKYLDLSRAYYIKTIDTSYNEKIVAFTDTTLSIKGRIKTGQDTTYTYSTFYNNRETTQTIKRPLYKEDIIIISFSNLQMLKKDWLKKRDWVQPFAWFGIGAVLGVVLLPVAAIDKGEEGVREWAIFEGILVGISAPPIILATGKTKYDLTKDWTIKVER